jgi:hypothetical protein
MENGVVASTASVFTFTVNADHTLYAMFTPDPRLVSFTFDDARQYSPLPVTLSSGGLGVVVSATGQGYSIQAIGASGISPAGFSGLCLDPSSVFQADLIFDFSAPLTEFSIMYSPQELGCDTSATMRATASTNGSFVATATATAPIPGTWPTGTLGVTAAAGFNRVVVHYDSRPPTCQDWGPIFLADNMLVMRATLCAADFNRDGSVDFFDYLDFVDAFSIQSSAADFNHDGVLDFFDYLDFVDAFSIAC